MNWWRRQRVPLVALVATVIAAAGVHFWLDVLPSPEADTQTIIEVERRGEIAGQTISVDAVRWDEFDAPSGSRTISVLLDATGGKAATTCGAFSLSEVEGPRVWLDARADVDAPSDAGERGCLEESLSYEIFVVFLVPDDAVGPFQLDIPDRDGRIARFIIEP